MGQNRDEGFGRPHSRSLVSYRQGAKTIERFKQYAASPGDCLYLTVGGRGEGGTGRGDEGEGREGGTEGGRGCTYAR